MDGSSWLQFLLLIFFLSGSVYFALSESSMSAANTIRLKGLADDGNKRAKIALHIIHNFDHALTVILIGTNISHVAFASLSTVFAFSLFQNVPASTLTTYTTIISTVVVFLIGDMIPKTLANARSEGIAMACARSLRLIMKILSPVAFIFSRLARFASKLFKGTKQPTITEEELYHIIDTIEEEGVMGEEQSDLLKSALGYAKTTVGDVMTMREDIVALDIHATDNDIAQLSKTITCSRLPVYDGTLDNIVGILKLRKYFLNRFSSRPVPWQELLFPPFYTTTDANIDDLLQEMSKQKEPLALVEDKDGKILGLATTEDFLEELVGEIWDEDDVVDENFVKLGGNRYQVNPQLTVTEAFRRMEYTPDNLFISSTKSLQAWVLENLGHIPEEDEEFNFEKLNIMVTAVMDNRITEIIIKRNVEIDLPLIPADAAVQ